MITTQESLGIPQRHEGRMRDHSNRFKRLRAIVRFASKGMAQPPTRKYLINTKTGVIVLAAPSSRHLYKQLKKELRK